MNNIRIPIAFIYIAMGMFIPTIYTKLMSYGIPYFGVLMSATAITGAISSYYIGKYSDIKHPIYFLRIVYIVYLFLLLSFYMSSSFFSLLIIQSVYGVFVAIGSTLESIIISKYSVSVGKDFGSYHLVIGIASGLAILVGGILSSVISLLASVLFVIFGIVWVFFVVPR